MGDNNPLVCFALASHVRSKLLTHQSRKWTELLDLIISIYHQLLFHQYKESDYFDSYLDARLFTWTCKAMTELMMFFATTSDKVGVVSRRACSLAECDMLGISFFPKKEPERKKTYRKPNNKIFSQ